MHGEFLDFGHGKMSRSKGNVILVSTLKEQGIDPMAYRYLLLTGHYRSKMNFTDESITAAQNGLNNLRDDLAQLLEAAPEAKQAAGPWSKRAQRVTGNYLTRSATNLKRRATRYRIHPKAQSWCNYWPTVLFQKVFPEEGPYQLAAGRDLLQELWKKPEIDDLPGALE